MGITKREVDATRPQQRDVFVWDNEEPGFGLKVTPGGAKIFIFQYRMGGRGFPTRRYTIGRFGAFTPDEARRTARRLRSQVSEGKDPARLKVEARDMAQQETQNTFGRLAADYIKRECPQLIRGADIEAVIRRELIPAWGNRPVPELRKRDAIALTDALVDAGKPAAAHKLHETIKRTFSWAVDRDNYDIEVSPFAGMKPPVEKEVRQRALRDGEIKALLTACKMLDYPFGSVLRLLLLTGQRRNEVAEMQWSELELDVSEWVIPAGRSKSKREHLVPLSPAALGIIDSLPRFAGPYVFTTTEGRRPVSGFSKAKTRVDALCGVSDWRIHDLRRTCRTGMAALGVPEIVGERVLNHLPRGLSKTYNVHEYEDEKRDALARWAQRVSQIVTPPPANVVPMPATA